MNMRCSLCPSPLAWILGILVALALPPAQGFHFPWDQGHDYTDWDDPPPPGPCPGGVCTPCGSTGSPVYIPTGHLIWPEKDVDVFGVPSLSLSRTYNSHDPRNGIFGNGWTVGCDVALLKVSSSDGIQFVLRASDGKRYVYELSDDGTVTPPPGRFDVVLPQPDGGANLEARDGSTREFDSIGRLRRTVDANGNALSYEYEDGTGLLIRIRDDHGRFLNITYNATGHVSTVADHTTRTWSFAYDADGNLVGVRNPAGDAKTYTYQSYQAAGDGHEYHQLTTVTDESGVVTTAVTYLGERVSSYTAGANRYTYAYDTSAKTVTKTDSVGSRWSYTYDADGVITNETDPIGNSVVSEYDVDGNLVRFTDERGKIWSASYDTLGRVTTETDPLNNSVQWEYSGNYPWPVKLTSPTGRVTLMTYDAMGNMVRYTDAAGEVVAFERDARGFLTKTVDPLGNETTFTNDALGRPVSVVDPLGRETRKAYDSLSNLVSATNPRGDVTQYEYDVLNRLVKSIDPLGAATLYTYDPAGRLRNLTDPAGNVTTYTYDSFGRMVERTAPDGRRTTYQYRTDNQVSQVTHPTGLAITYDYDALKRNTRKVVGSETFTFTYDGRGNLTQATNDSGTVSRTFDDTGQLTGETINGRSVGVTLNAEGERTQLTALGTTTNYTRDVRGLLNSIESASGRYEFLYNSLGSRTQLRLPNSTAVDYTYDAANQLTELVHSGPLNAEFNYTYDAAGSLVDQAGTSEQRQYEYDANDRVTRADIDGETFNYEYDDNGNLGTGGRIHDEANRLTEDDQYDYEYDLAGNLAQKVEKTTGAKTVYQWDAQNQLASVERFADAISTVPFNVLEFTYGPLGRRLTKTEDGVVESYVYDRFNRIGTIDATGSIVQAVTFGPGADEPLGMTTENGDRFFHADQLGSVIALTDDSVVTSQYAYDPYGTTRVTGEQESAFGFTGREMDAPDLYFYRTRYFDPSMARFISEDPLGLAAGVNLYGYVGGNPITKRDPLGLMVGDPAYCERLRNRIRNVEKEVRDRGRELREDKLNLPKTCPGDDLKPSLSREGHRKLLNMAKANLARLKGLYAAYCSNTPPPPPVPVPAPEPNTNPGTNPLTGVNWEAVAVGVVAVVAIGALIYFSGGTGVVVLGATSDRRRKKHFANVDQRAILEQVVKLPITQWSYKVEPSSTRHLGPMAQDFHAAFGLGGTNRRIAQVDGDGVALAAIQALHELLEDKDERIASLESRLDALQEERTLPRRGGVTGSGHS